MTLGNLSERSRHDPALIPRERCGFVAHKESVGVRWTAAASAAAEPRIVAEIEITLPLALVYPGRLDSQRDSEACAAATGGSAAAQALDVEPVARVAQGQEVLTGNQSAVAAAVVREGGTA